MVYWLYVSTGNNLFWLLKEYGVMGTVTKLGLCLGAAVGLAYICLLVFQSILNIVIMRIGI